MNAFEAMQAAIYSDPNLSEVAAYTLAAGGPSFSVRVLRESSDAISGTARAPKEAVTVLTASIPDGAKRGDQLVMGGKAYPVEAVERVDAWTSRLVLSWL